MSAGIGVSVTSFGIGRRRLELPPDRATVGEAIKETGFNTDRRRVAINGLQADSGTAVREGDLVTIVPKIIGG